MRREIRKPGKELKEGLGRRMVTCKAMLQPPPESVEGEKDVDLFEELEVKRVEKKGTGNEGRDLGGEVTGISMV